MRHSGDMATPSSSRQKGKLTKNVSTAEPVFLPPNFYFYGSGRNEVDVPGNVTAAHENLSRLCKSCLKGPHQFCALILVHLAEDGKTARELDLFHRQIQFGPKVEATTCRLQVLDQLRKDLATDKAITVEDVIFLFLQAQRGAADEAPLHVSGIVGILQLQSLKRLPRFHFSPFERFMKNLGNALAVDPPNFSIDVFVQVGEDQTLVQQNLEAVCRHVCQHAGQAEPVVQPYRQLVAGPATKRSAGGIAIPIAAARSCAFNHTIDIAQHVLDEARREQLLTERVEDHVALTARERNKSKGDAVAVARLVSGFGTFKRCIEARRKGFGLAANHFSVKFVPLRCLRYVLPHVLKGNGDHLVRERLIQRRQPVELQLADQPSQGGALHQAA